MRNGRPCAYSSVLRAWEMERVALAVPAEGHDFACGQTRDPLSDLIPGVKLSALLYRLAGQADIIDSAEERQ